MDFNQVRYFLALAETLNFTKAAALCYVSQPALTQAIKRLEEELGGELINRVGRDTELTELGTKILEQFQIIDESRQTVKTTAKAVCAGEVAELQIGIMCTVGPRILSKLLADFQKKHESISLVLRDITPAEIDVKLMAGELDGVFCARHKESSAQLKNTFLFKEPMVIIFPEGHSYSAMDVVSVREVATQRYVDRVLCEFRDDFIKLFQRENLHLDVAFSSQREDWIQNMVRDGVGVCILPRYSLLEPELDYRPVKDPTLSRNIEFSILKQSTISPALELLNKHVQDYDWSSQALEQLV